MIKCSNYNQPLNNLFPLLLSSLTVQGVNEILDQLASADPNKDAREATRRRAIETLVRKTTALQHKWIVRIILKDLKIGVSETTVSTRNDLCCFAGPSVNITGHG